MVEFRYTYSAAVGLTYYEIFHDLSTYGRGFLEKTTVFLTVNKFPAYYGSESSLPQSKESATCPYPEPEQSITCPPRPPSLGSILKKYCTKLKKNIIIYSKIFVSLLKLEVCARGSFCEASILLFWRPIQINCVCACACVRAHVTWMAETTNAYRFFMTHY